MGGREVAFDDGLTERLRHCLLCGRTPPHWLGLGALGTLCVAYVLCRACDDRDRTRQRVQWLLEQRYAGARLEALLR